MAVCAAPTPSLRRNDRPVSGHFLKGLQQPFAGVLPTFRMLRLILIYSASTGLQRAIVFLASIVLARSYTLTEVGQYILTQTIAQLIVPLLTLNTTVALARESGQNPRAAAVLLRRVALAAAAVFVVGSLVGWLAPAARWVVTGINLGACEAMFVASIAFLQGAERAPLIFKFSSAKTALFGVLLLLCYLKWLSIDAFVVLLSVVNFALACVLMRVVTAAAGFGGPDKSPLAPAAMLRYSVATLPHTVALWISVSSDRLMLGALVGKEAVGRYSLSYTVAQAVMVIISGVITALPPRIANDPDHWRIPGHVVGFLKKTALVCFAVLVMLLLFTSVNNHYLHIVPNTGPLSYYLIAIISAGFFFSNYYVLFASYLYLNRNTAALSTAGLLVGPVWQCCAETRTEPAAGGATDRAAVAGLFGRRRAAGAVDGNPECVSTA
jgi:O-antigen/teichoic acid export membrane protein